MTDYELIKAQIEDLKAKIEKNSISPLYMGNILDELLGKLQSVDLHGITEKLYQQLVAAGYKGTAEEMYVMLVGLLYHAYETNIDAPARIVPEGIYSESLGPGETATISFPVYKGTLPITALVTKWSISREGGDAPSDAVWNSSAKAVNFSGTIDLTVDDLSTVRQSTTFTVTAEGSFSEGAVSYNIEI